MSDQAKLTTIGQSEHVDFPLHNAKNVPARIDTGARTSAVWASDVTVTKSGVSFKLFDTQSEFYTGETIEIHNYEETVVASSVGHPQLRYKVQLPLRIKGKRIKASFTLADRSAQTYPVLIGRSTLRGKFVVDVKAGTVLKGREKDRTAELRNLFLTNQETES
jgi:hypothetical protein